MFVRKLIAAIAVCAALGAPGLACAETCYLVLRCAHDGIYHPVKCDEDGCKTADGDEAVREVNVYVGARGWGVEREQSPSRRETPFYQAWLEFMDEFDKDGREANAFQKEAIRRKIAALGKQKKTIFVVVFVHGWHNNADNSMRDHDPSPDSVKFDHLMGRHAEQVRRLFEQRGVEPIPAVLGIYVGWRGDSLTTPGMSYLTLSDRAGAADRLADPLNSDQNSLYNSLKYIADVLHAADPNGRMLVAGHSLGGRIVTRLFMDDIAGGNVQPLGPNSLLVAMEPAVGADCYDKLLGAQQKPDGRSGPPAFISITSRNDGAIEWLYPWAARLFRVGNCDDFSRARGVTVGSYGDYLTHELRYPLHWDGGSKDGPSEGVAFPPVDSKYNWFSKPDRKTIAYKERKLDCQSDCYNYNTDLHSADRYVMEFKELGNARRAGPVWNILTDKTVIDMNASDQPDSWFF
jgi:pimeloyl-ACP methyl ester carboxylesterase